MMWVLLCFVDIWSAASSSVSDVLPTYVYRATIHAFNVMYDMGLIYRGEPCCTCCSRLLFVRQDCGWCVWMWCTSCFADFRLVHWSCALRTALSDEEVCVHVVMCES